MTTPSRPSSLVLAQLCQGALEEKKAGDVRVFDVSSVSSITNFLVIATATSEPHLRALRVELEKVLDGSKSHIVGMETSLESGWTVIDAFDVMVHLFTAERRELYGLETLWKDAPELGKEKPAKAAKRKVAKPLKGKVKKAKAAAPKAQGKRAKKKGA